MDDITNTNVSPYLLRPLRKLDEVLAQRVQDQERKVQWPRAAWNGRFVVITGGKN
jgi:hypothetical protein